MRFEQQLREVGEVMGAVLEGVQENEVWVRGLEVRVRGLVEHLMELEAKVEEQSRECGPEQGSMEDVRVLQGKVREYLKKETQWNEKYHRLQLEHVEKVEKLHLEIQSLQDNLVKDKEKMQELTDKNTKLTREAMEHLEKMEEDAKSAQDRYDEMKTKFEEQIKRMEEKFNERPSGEALYKRKIQALQKELQAIKSKPKI